MKRPFNVVRNVGQTLCDQIADHYPRIRLRPEKSPLAARKK